MPKPKYDHALSFNFSFKSLNEEPSPEEILKELRDAVNNLTKENISDSVEIWDSTEEW